jgi:hypothetical protein
VASVRPYPIITAKVTNPRFFLEIGGMEIIVMSGLIQWRTDWQEAREEAKKFNRLLALEFYLDG